MGQELRPNSSIHPTLCLPRVQLNIKIKKNWYSLDEPGQNDTFQSAKYTFNCKEGST